ncbi:MAG: hypothetical protein A2600_09905 [Candidatus Lambdaproteobacteria bacterium RIFOXYD1_FULL_56_27]|uniref:Uncharacterized protein n=1 Tax=Candidatus Lambdaproteobacteria bacterium RIFOXYD2_FULL_56_26 TaxID=1817773 RepID=A0A1F6GUB2_9PROT|nr:MAG: hypothetical protein A2557_11785 [Candidatus Lambdaproteobacteria bacterium RIFOXYD2_FULL_56_26]OGH04331.1 MAG: hypothetical protein A2426_05760 [Candidatus Lambdaproteobacteria bacterium RIFOXYC1_FULL_56_13]OGH07393.1 MAG: hypothetical protein A2600_09905 [Candidatus Lambdaproteobacteria bacterium RIFOXYD1_FULL_56_27]
MANGLFAAGSNPGVRAFGLFVLLVLVHNQAQAFATPAAGTAFYPIWDVLYNKLFKGAVGAGFALGGVTVGGLIMASGDIKKGAMTGIGLGTIAQADTIVTGLGICVGFGG